MSRFLLILGKSHGNMSCSVVDSFWDTFTIIHNHSPYFGILVLAIWQAGASAMIIFEQFPDAQEGFWMILG